MKLLSRISILTSSQSFFPGLALSAFCRLRSSLISLAAGSGGFGGGPWAVIGSGVAKFAGELCRHLVTGNGNSNFRRRGNGDGQSLAARRGPRDILVQQLWRGRR